MPGSALLEDRANLERAFQVLTGRERVIIYLRFYESVSQTEIAKRLNVSQMHVSRLQAKALEKLRAVLADRPPVGRPARHDAAEPLVAPQSRLRSRCSASSLPPSVAEPVPSERSESRARRSELPQDHVARGDREPCRTIAR